MNKLNIEKLRLDTPGCKHVLHFNNAGAALAPTPVIRAIKNHLDLESIEGGYEAAKIAAVQIEKFYDVAATLVNCNRDEIAFMENATRAWDMAFYSLRFKKNDRILTSVSEYASNFLAFLHMAKHTGVIVDVIPNDAYGQLDVKELDNKITSDVKLIAITHVPTQGGLINPAEAIGSIANQADIPYLLDATQSVGQMPIDVQNIGCDFLCATGRKYLRGPRGTGFLYARKKIIERCEPPFLDLHSATWTENNKYTVRSDALRFETWEQNIAGKIGLATAIEYALKLQIPVIWERIQHLALQLREQLSRISSIELRDLGDKKCGIITFTSKEKSAEELQHYLTKKKMNVQVSLQEYARLDMVQRNIPALIRASVHYYNTEEEINIFCEAVKQCIVFC